MTSAITDPLPSHMTGNEVLKLARDRQAQPFHCGDRIIIQRGSFQRAFPANSDGLFRAAPIRSFVGAA